MTKAAFKSILAAAALTAHGCIGLALCLLFTESASADEFHARPDSVQFDFERKDGVQFDFEQKKDGAQNRTCNLMTMIRDPSRPEVVNFRIIHALSPTTLFFGYSLDVGDMRYQTGLPAGLDQVVLARGEVSTGDFSSEGSMYGGPTPDGGIIKSTLDQQTAGNLWRGIVAGDFSLHLLRATPGAQPRTYVIAKAPSPGPLAQYLACSTEISDIALGELARPDLYARIRHGGPGFTEPLHTDHGTVIPPLELQSPVVGKR